jgi:hypothetical protein
MVARLPGVRLVPLPSEAARALAPGVLGDEDDSPRAGLPQEDVEGFRHGDSMTVAVQPVYAKMIGGSPTILGVLPITLRSWPCSRRCSSRIGNKRAGRSVGPRGNSASASASTGSLRPALGRRAPRRGTGSASCTAGRTRSLRGSSAHDPDAGARVVAALGEPAASEFLEILERPDADRAALIGRLPVRDDAAWLAELLMDLEGDIGEVAGLRLVDELRRRLGVLIASPQG